MFCFSYTTPYHKCRWVYLYYCKLIIHLCTTEIRQLSHITTCYLLPNVHQKSWVVIVNTPNIKKKAQNVNKCT